MRCTPASLGKAVGVFTPASPQTLSLCYDGYITSSRNFPAPL